MVILMENLIYHLLLMLTTAVIRPVANTAVDICSVCEGCMYGTVSCQDPGRLSAVPNQLPSGIRKMILIEQRFERQHLSVENISTYSRPNFGIEEITIMNCGLLSIQSNTFYGLKYLTKLDLSRNSLTRILSHTFAGLKLQLLRLDGNVGLTLAPGALENLTVTSLSMQNCEIKSLTYLDLEPLIKTEGLSTLRLSGNRLKTLDSRFSQLFLSLKAFSLSQNNFHCDCNLLWLSRTLFLRNQKIESELLQLPSVMEEFQLKNDHASSSTLYPVCATPYRLQNKSIQTLSQEDVYCIPPSLKTLEIELVVSRKSDVERMQATFKCVVQGSPELELGWFRKTSIGSKQRHLFDFEHLPQSRVVSAGITQITLEQPKYDTNAYPTLEEDLITCIASDAQGNATADVRIIWPAKFESTVDVPTLADSADYKIPEILDQADNQKLRFELIHADRMGDIFFKKNFTVLDLIGAVVGTFSATIALFLVGFSLLQTWRRKQFDSTNNSGRNNAGMRPGYVEEISRFWLSPDDALNSSNSPIECNVNSKIFTSQENPFKNKNLRQLLQYSATNDDSAYSDCHTYDLPLSGNNSNSNRLLPRNRQPETEFRNNFSAPENILFNDTNEEKLMPYCNQFQQCETKLQINNRGLHNNAKCISTGKNLDHFSNNLNPNPTYEPQNFRNNLKDISPDFRNYAKTNFSSNNALITKFNPLQNR